MNKVPEVNIEVGLAGQVMITQFNLLTTPTGYFLADFFVLCRIKASLERVGLYPLFFLLKGLKETERFSCKRHMASLRRLF